MRLSALHPGTADTRLSILELIALGASFDEIQTDYPSLEHEDIVAAVQYAARQADHVVLQSS